MCLYIGHPISMSKKSIVFALFTILSMVGPSVFAEGPASKPIYQSTGAKALTLQDCFELARGLSEDLRIQQEAINQYKSQKKEAIGSILPDIHWTQSTVWQDQSGLAVSSNTNFDNTAFKKRTTQSQFTFRQPIFSGFKEFSAMRGFSAAVRAETYDFNRANILLYRDVASAFLNAVAFETDLANIRMTIKLDADRLKELRERIRVGRSRDSELVSAESQVANLESQEARTLGDLAVARESLSYLIGQDASASPLIDNLGTPSLPTEENADQTAERRSDLLALKETAEGKRFAIRVARSDYWPDLDFTGNYYTRRLGFLKEIDWDVAFNIDVAIFQGGQTKAQSDRAVSEWKQAKLRYEQGRRLAHSEIKRSRLSLAAALKTAELLEDAYTKARRSYELQAKEYRYGLVSNLDVLQALATMLTVKQSWDRAIVQGKSDAIDLMAATEKEFNP